MMKKIGYAVTLTWDIVKLNLGIVLNSRKFVGVLIFLFAINTLPGFVSYIMASKFKYYSALSKILDFTATWEVLLLSNVFAVILPLFLTSIALNDQIRVKRIFNTVVRPIKREIIFASMMAAILIISLIIGLSLGAYFYLSLTLGALIGGKLISIPPMIVLQLTLLITLSALFYSNFMALISLYTRDYGLKSIIVFFFLTMLFDLLFTALGGNYLLVTLNYYKISILYNLAGDPILMEKLAKQIPIPPASIPTTFLTLTLIAAIVFFLALKLFINHDIN